MRPVPGLPIRCGLLGCIDDAVLPLLLHPKSMCHATSPPPALRGQHPCQSNSGCSFCKFWNRVPLCPLLPPPLVLPHPLSFPRGGGGRHLVNTKFFVTSHCVGVGDSVVRHCHLYPLYSWQDILELDSTRVQGMQMVGHKVMCLA